MTILFNPVVVSVIVLTVLCLLKFNILLALIVSAIVGGLVGGLPLAVIDAESKLAFLSNLPGFVSSTSGETGIIDTLIGGMGGNSSTALAYILLGIFAVGLARTGLGDIVSKKLSQSLSGSKRFIVFILAFIACFSQNLIPIHIAFIPILIPPLLKVFNNLKLDRRAVACALTFGLKAPYVTLPLGFGAIFHGIINDQVNANGLSVTLRDVSGVMWIAGLSMLVGLFIAVLLFTAKDRIY